MSLIANGTPYRKRAKYSGVATVNANGIAASLDKLPAGQLVMLKLTLPEVDDFYRDLIAHRNVLKVVALSGGYSREDANAMLAKNTGLIASFSRALSEGLSAQQSDAQFNAELEKTIGSIYDASVAG